MWWVDAAFTVHHNMKSHTNGEISVVEGAVYSTLIKQKLNTKRSTEAELLGLDDLMPKILWMRYFLEVQGFKVYDNIAYRYNHSSVKLEKHGPESSGK